MANCPSTWRLSRLLAKVGPYRSTPTPIDASNPTNSSATSWPFTTSCCRRPAPEALPHSLDGKERAPGLKELGKPAPLEELASCKRCKFAGTFRCSSDLKWGCSICYQLKFEPIPPWKNAKGINTNQNPCSTMLLQRQAKENYLCAKSTTFVMSTGTQIDTNVSKQIDKTSWQTLRFWIFAHHTPS